MKFFVQKSIIFCAALIITALPLFAMAQTLPETKTRIALAPSGTKPRGFVYSVSSFTITYNEQKFPVDAATLKTWQGISQWQKSSAATWQSPDLQNSLLAFFGIAQEQLPAPTIIYHYQSEKIYNFIETLATGINQPAIEPSLTIINDHITNFTPPQTGLEVDSYKTTGDILRALEENKTAAEMSVNQILPQKNLGDTNNLGIKELVAEGISGFKGSPNNRRFNIAVGIEKMKGVLIAPGDTFSFNDNLGPVDGENGFLPELVIKGNNTIPEFGGGLCQVSTTTFRAAMNAGLPILERRNHAYAVQYYSPQGTDATIYPGSVDLKFRNDTPGTILIWPYEKDKNTLVFDFYGTKDSRQVTLDKPVITDRQPDGSMKASWTRHVLNNGVTVTNTFKSDYQSPALFHHDTQFVSATGTPTSSTQTTPPKAQ